MNAILTPSPSYYCLLSHIRFLAPDFSQGLSQVVRFKNGTKGIRQLFISMTLLVMPQKDEISVNAMFPNSIVPKFCKVGLKVLLVNYP